VQRAIDPFLDLQYLEWRGNVQRFDNNGSTGIELQNIVEGGALMFVDALAHGAATRTNPGERRAVIYRFGPTWGNTRYGYRYSPELLAREPQTAAKSCSLSRPTCPADQVHS
jgi:ectoine hydroxylase-related dioxygenase (phytanoyl-CoA dioxygenase family)